MTQGLQAGFNRKGRRARAAFRRALGFSGAAAYIFALPIDAAQAGGQAPLPSGGVVSAGGVVIVQPNSSTLDINQSTARAIINWNSFSIGAGDTVNFNQPSASSATLNRVTGATPSWIGGAINAPGTVLLVNPNGIEFTKSGTVNTGSFAASTLGIKDSDFLAGNYAFTGDGASAAVVNNGRIDVSDGGFAALLGGQVANNGIISARLGSVGLGAGEQATLDLSGDGFLSVAIPSSEMGKLVDPNGALVSDKGKILADGGTVYLSAATAANILKNAINIPGEVRVNTVGTHNGKIVINGGDGGTVAVSGRLAANGGKQHKAGSIAIAGANVSVTGKLAANGASGGAISVIAAKALVASGVLEAKGTSGQGGEIDLTAADVTLTGALVDASGATGGGAINIGGGPHASVALADAQTVSIDAASVIRADATDNGDGGHVVIWSDQNTTFAGLITATGGPNGGNGGNAEVSGDVNLTLTGFANLGAPDGTIGTLLLDPGSVNIVSGSNTYVSADTFNAAYLNAQLGAASIIIDTNNATGANGPAGDITLESGAAISWSAATTLTLNAAHDIVFATGSSISASGGSVVLNAGDNASGFGAVTFQGSGAQVSTAGGTSAYYNPAVLGTANFQSSSVSGPLTAYMLVNNAGQFNSIGNNYSGDYALATNINLGTYSPLGLFEGLLNGRGYTLTYTINGTDESAGLFETIGDSGVIDNLNVSGTVYSGYYIGGITANNDGIIENSSASLNAVFYYDYYNNNSTGSSERIGSGTAFLGGLVAVNNATGRIINSTAVINNTSGGGGVGTVVGGLVGNNYGSITNSSASGTITAELSNANDNPNTQFYIGGLVGLNQTGATITNSFASTYVDDPSGDYVFSDDGGFVGYNQGAISSSFATGRVYGGITAGGFAGDNEGIINTSFSTGNVQSSSSNGNAGGFAGVDGVVDESGYSGQLLGAEINQSYSTGQVSGGGEVSGFIGVNGGTNSNNYWDTTTSGVSYAALDVTNALHSCACGTTAVQSAAPVTGYAFSAVSYSSAFLGSAWYVNDGFTRPLPIGFRTGAITTSNSLLAAIQLELIGSAPSANYTLGTNVNLSVTSSSPLWSSLGFGPIGAFDDGHGAAFTGTFNGAGYTISNLNIAALHSDFGVYIGLFGQQDGLVENVGLSGGAVTGIQVVGAIAGANSGTITNSYATTSVSGGNNVGGLVGFNEASGIISNAYSTGAVASGLAGPSDTGPAGGIAGANQGVIIDTYAANVVTAPGSVAGGIVGDNEYYTGATSVTQSYWNTDFTSAGVGTSDAGTTFSGSGLSTAAMQDLSNFQTNFVGFNFNTIWAPPNQAGQGGDAAANYPQLYADSHVIWVDSSGATATYGTAPVLTDTLYGLHNYDLPAIVQNLTLSSTGGSSPDVGSYGVTESGATATSTDSSSYRFVTSGTLTVNALALSGSAAIAAIDKTYDGNNSASGGSVQLTSGNGVINGDTISLSATSGAYTNGANVDGVETVDLTGVTLTGAKAIDYTIGNLTYSGTGQIAPATLTYTATLASMTYGGAAPSVTGVVTGLVGTDTLLSATSGTAIWTPGATSSSNVGAYAITGSGLTPNNGNYVFMPAAGNATALTVTPAALTITATNQTNTYGTVANLGATGFTEAGLVTTNGDGDSITGVTLTSPGSVASATVGAYTLTPSAALGGGLSNYTITYANAPTGLTVTPAALTITANNQSMIYGSAGNSLIDGVTPVGLVNGDKVTGETLLTNATISSTSGYWNAGDWKIKPSAATGSGLSNYVITYKTGSLDVAAEAITISAVSGGKIYDGTTSSNLTPTFAGLIAGDKVVDLSESYNSPNVVSATTLSVNSRYRIRDGNNGKNYVVTLATASGAITPAAITLNGIKTYDSTTAFTSGDFGLGGTILTGIGLQTLNVTGGSGSVGSANVVAGLQTLNTNTLTLADGGGLFGGLASNYAIATVGNTGVVIPATISLAGTKVYDGNGVFAAADFGADGTINTGIDNETLNVTGSGLALSSNVSAGNQFLAPTKLGLADGSGLASNYRISLLGNTGLITPATLTYVATANGMIYGGAVPSLSGDVTGFVNGQNLASATGGTLAFNTAANALTNVGSYAIAGSGLTANNGNYTFVQAAANSTAFTITPATLTYVATANGMIYGGAVPSLSGDVTGFVSGQDLASATSGTLAFTTAANALTNVGSYAIAGSGLTANNGNYTFVQGAANANAFTISPATLTYVANTYAEPAAAPFPIFTGTVTGFVNGEDLASATTGAAAFTTLATPLSPLGPYAIDGSGLTANDGDYIFAQAATNATALTLQQSQSYVPSTVPGSTNGTTPNTTNINVDVPGSSPIAKIGFSSQGATAGSGANIYPSGLQTFTRSHGLDFEPISQYDANQYSHFKLPDFDDRDGEAALFTILARAASHGHGSDYLIDGFWNDAGPTWTPSAPAAKPSGAITFSDGAGHTAAPTLEAAFPIVSGHTNMALLLKNGPVMIVGPTSQKPAEWLLALGLTPDGKDVVADDPITGKVVELSYDAATQTLGGISGVFDPKTKMFAPLAQTNTNMPNGGNALFVLKSFTPTSYIAVAIR